MVVKATKHSAPARGSKLLQRFANAHGLDIQTEDAESRFCKEFGLEPPADRGNLNPFSPQICFGDDAAIADPSDDPLLIEIWGSKAALTRTLRNTRIKEPLLLVLFLERKNNLYESIGFDISSYGYGSVDPNNPNNSNWGRILHRVGLRYFDGDDGTISFLFPSRDKTSVALALALAGSSECESLPWYIQAAADAAEVTARSLESASASKRRRSAKAEIHPQPVGRGAMKKPSSASSARRSGI